MGSIPEFSGRDNVFLNARILSPASSKSKSATTVLSELFADIVDFIDQPVKSYSSGMFVRLAFAVQAHIDASIVIIDEALAVGDVFFPAKMYARLEALRDSGAAILLVSHAKTDIEQFCDRAILLDHGGRIIRRRIDRSCQALLSAAPAQDIERVGAPPLDASIARPITLPRVTGTDFWPEDSGVR